MSDDRFVKYRIRPHERQSQATVGETGKEKAKRKGGGGQVQWDVLSGGSLSQVGEMVGEHRRQMLLGLAEPLLRGPVDIVSWEQSSC